MTRAEIIKGLKDIYGKLYANLYLRKALDLKIIEACLELLEKENDVIDRIMAQINTPNRGTCDYFIVDKIEEIISEYRGEQE